MAIAASERRSRTRKVRAMFTLQLPCYESWEMDANAEKFVITIVGAEDVAAELKTMTNGKTVLGRSIDVVPVSTTSDLPKSNVVYVSPKHADKARSIVKGQHGHNTLFVGGESGMGDTGVQVALVGQGDKVGFEWSKRNVKNGGVKISPKVLNLGKELN